MGGGEKTFTDPETGCEVAAPAYTSIPHTRERCLTAERDALQAIVDKLPKTADGVVVVYGDTIFTADGIQCEAACGVGGNLKAFGSVGPEGYLTEVTAIITSIAKCYSTPEAAQAAMEAKP